MATGLEICRCHLKTGGREESLSYFASGVFANVQRQN